MLITEKSIPNMSLSIKLFFGASVLHYIIFINLHRSLLQNKSCRVVTSVLFRVIRMSANNCRSHLQVEAHQALMAQIIFDGRCT